MRRLCRSILEYFLHTFTKVFFVRSVLGDKLSVVEQVPSFLKIGHQHTAQEEDQ